MLVDKECPACADAKKLFKDKISSGAIRLVELVTDEGKALFKKHNLLAVPVVLYKDKKTNVTKTCKVTFKGTKIKCDNDTEEVEL